VPDPERAAFLEAYAAEVVAGCPLHVVESTARGTYRMFADIDLKAANEASGAALAAAVLDIAVSALPELPELSAAGTAALVCSRGWSPKDGKIGIHITFESVRVDDEAALALRNEWVDRIASGPCSGNGRDWWDATIDVAVYRNSGLRMPWSRKVGGCPRSIYVPSHVVAFNGTSAHVAKIAAVDLSDASDVLRWLQRATLAAAAARTQAKAGAEGDGRERDIVDLTRLRSAVGQSVASKFVMKRPAFDRLNYAEKSAFCLGGGKITL
jgi:hypothetical protein